MDKRNNETRMVTIMFYSNWKRKKINDDPFIVRGKDDEEALWEKKYFRFIELNLLERNGEPCSIELAGISVQRSVSYRTEVSRLIRRKENLSSTKKTDSNILCKFYANQPVESWTCSETYQFVETVWGCIFYDV